MRPLGLTDQERLEQILQMISEPPPRSLAERFWEWIGNLLGRSDAGATGSLPSWAFWIIGFIGLMGAFLLLRSLVRGLSGHTSGEQVVVLGKQTSRLTKELTPAERFALARQRAEAGDYQEALRLVQVALLQFWDQRGLVRFGKAETNRSYERQLRRQHPVLAEGLARFHLRLEEQLYSGRPLSSGDYHESEQAAEQLWREGDAISQRAKVTTSG